MRASTGAELFFNDWDARDQKDANCDAGGAADTQDVRDDAEEKVLEQERKQEIRCPKHCDLCCILVAVGNDPKKLRKKAYFHG